MVRRGCLLVALLVTGCYFEGTAAYHPRISQKVRPAGGTAADEMTATGGGWSLGINIGIYLDVGIETSRYTRGFGAGASGYLNGYGIAPSKPLASQAAKALIVRGDVLLPTTLLTRHFIESVTFAYHWLGDISTKIGGEKEPAMGASSSGHMWFAGVGLDWRSKTPAWNGKLKTTVVRLNLGVERYNGRVTNEDDRISWVESTGIGARLMIMPAFIGQARKGPYEDMNTSKGPPPSCSGGYYRDQTTNGTTTTQWVCP